MKYLKYLWYFLAVLIAAPLELILIIDCKLKRFISAIDSRIIKITFFDMPYSPYTKYIINRQLRRNAYLLRR